MKIFIKLVGFHINIGSDRLKKLIKNRRNVGGVYEIRWLWLKFFKNS